MIPKYILRQLPRIADGACLQHAWYVRFLSQYDPTVRFVVGQITIGDDTFPHAWIEAGGHVYCMIYQLILPVAQWYADYGVTRYRAYTWQETEDIVARDDDMLRFAVLLPE